MPENCAQTFLSAFYADQQPDMTCIDRLCSLALSPDVLIAKQAVLALYGSIVEGLCDDFSSQGVTLCNNVLLRIIAYLHDAGKTGTWARTLGIGSPGWEEKLLCRYEELIRQGRMALRSPPQKIIVLSRVTIGADVMITSILIQRLRFAFPKAEIVLVGPYHMGALLLLDDHVKSRLFPYERNCSLLERFEATRRLVQLVQEECRDIDFSRVLLVDPDSRLSQLGLIPLLPVEQCRYFCSRMEMEDREEASLVEISNNWLNQWLTSGRCSSYPKIWLAEENLGLARRFMDSIRGGNKSVLLINLGVGRDENKRIPPPFEEELLLTLLGQPDLVVVLDSGYSPAGLARAQNLMKRASQKGHLVDFVREEDIQRFRPEGASHLIGMRCSIGMIGALIAEADCFFGYDSCCQHLANALGVPTVVVFSGYRRERFLERWRPRNPKGNISIISCRHNGEMDLQQCDNLVEKVARTLLSRCHGIG
ncbi:MAG: glycosyltransferase family 9 protein [Deltaproteobacteria bacterium]